MLPVWVKAFGDLDKCLQITVGNEHIFLAGAGWAEQTQTDREMVYCAFESSKRNLLCYAYICIAVVTQTVQKIKLKHK